MPIVEDLKLYGPRLSHALERLLRVAAPICIALLRFFARLFPNAHNRFSSDVSRLGILAAYVWDHVAPRLSAWLRAHGTKRRHKKLRPIPGLDGPLCISQPVSPRAILTSESGPLQARLFVGSFAAVAIGFIAAVTTPDEPKDSRQVLSATPTDTGNPATAKFPDRLEPNLISGFATLTATQAPEPLPVPGVTIAEMVSIARPLNEGVEQSDAMALEVSAPRRKPKVNITAKANPTKQKQLTLGEQLPRLR